MNRGRRHPLPAARLLTHCRGELRRAGRRWQESLRERWLGFSAQTNPASGVQAAGAGQEIIVSLTTTPHRLSLVHLAVETLLRQSFKPQRIILWLSDKLPGVRLPFALARQRHRGLEIQFRRDLRSFTKLIHALREHPDSLVVTADDDVLYPRDWLANLLASHERAPRMIHCHRAHRILTGAAGGLKPYFDWGWLSPGDGGPSHQLLATGVSGILYPPGALHEEVFNEAAFLKLCPTADDIWFKAAALLNGTACVKVSRESREYPAVHGTQETGLFRRNSTDGSLDEQIRAVFAAYDLLPRLRELTPIP